MRGKTPPRPVLAAPHPGPGRWTPARPLTWTFKVRIGALPPSRSPYWPPPRAVGRAGWLFVDFYLTLTVIKTLLFSKYKYIFNHSKCEILHKRLWKSVAISAGHKLCWQTPAKISAEGNRCGSGIALHQASPLSVSHTHIELCTWRQFEQLEDLVAVWAISTVMGNSVVMFFAWVVGQISALSTIFSLRCGLKQVQTCKTLSQVRIIFGVRSLN